MKYKMILFDLDGTILNTLADLTNAVNYGLKKAGVDEIDIASTRRYIGNGIKNLCNLASNGVSSDVVFEGFKEYYFTHLHDMSYVYKNIPTVLLSLKDKCILGILSNKKDSLVREIEKYYFKDIFNFAYGEREGIERKPSPEAIELIKKEYNLKNEEILYIGDSEVDIEFSKNAKIDYIICTWGFRDKEELLNHNPMTIVDDPMEILKNI